LNELPDFELGPGIWCPTPTCNPLDAEAWWEGERRPQWSGTLSPYRHIAAFQYGLRLKCKRCGETWVGEAQLGASDPPPPKHFHAVPRKPPADQWEKREAYRQHSDDDSEGDE
jgi:hypothetical protein